MDLTEDEKTELRRLIYDALREDTDYATYYDPPQWPPRTAVLRVALDKLKGGT